MKSSHIDNNNGKKEKDNSISLPIPTATVMENSNSSSNLDGPDDNEVQFVEMNRSVSAPPVEFLTSIQSLVDDNDNLNFNTTPNNFNNNISRESSITNDPNYAAFFYSNSRFDPRLPLPNFYSPGQSWQMWPSSASATGGGATSNPSNGFKGGNSVIGGNFRPLVNVSSDFNNSVNGSNFKANENVNVISDRQSFNHRKNLVDMIQEDFPRTPSPVHTNLILNLNSTETEKETSMGIHLLTGKGTKDSIHKRNGIGNLNGSKKPFSISGSVDAVMAAAIEAENNEDINFGIENLNLLSEEDFGEIEVEVNDHHRLINRNHWNNTNNVMEPFGFAELSTGSNINSANSNYTPYVPIQTGRRINYDYNPSLSHQGYAPKSPIDQSHRYNNQNYHPRGHGSRNNYRAHESEISPYQVPVYDSNSNSNSLRDENIQSAILEDFRLNKSKRYELTDLKGMMIDFSTDQHGSRFIQQKLETCSDLEKEIVFGEIYPVALQLMTDVFGNYVIQKFFEYGSKDQRIALALLMHGQVLNLSLQMYGCRVVQKALENVPEEEQIRLVQELEGHVLRCVKDQNGNHVIQKCIECVPLNTNAPFLTASFLSQASHLAMHPYGCRVIQRIFEHGLPEHSRALLDELLKNTGTLIQDQYGNYVIQHVLEYGKPSERSRIIQFLQGRILEFSRHKFASNVVEKCVSFGSKIERQALIDEVITPISILKCEKSEDLSVSVTQSQAQEELEIPLHLMIKDQFANYVVQKMLEVVEVDGEQRESLLQCIKPQLFQLKKYIYGKHILVKVEKMLVLPPSQVIEPINSVSASRQGGGFNQNGKINNNNQQTPNYLQTREREHKEFREYYSAPNSPTSSKSSQNFDRRPKPKISKNDLNEFPPLSPNLRKK